MSNEYKDWVLDEAQERALAWCGPGSIIEYIGPQDKEGIYLGLLDTYNTKYLIYVKFDDWNLYNVKEGRG